MVLAAGSSQRFGGRPKQFEDLGDATVLQRAVRAFTGVADIAETWVVTSAEHRARPMSCWSTKASPASSAAATVARQSTQLGLAALAPEVSHVIIHDAARPLVPREVVANCVAALADADVVATVIEPADSVVILDGDTVVSTPDRSSVRLYQTPQAFRCSVLTAAWERLAAERERITHR